MRRAIGSWLGGAPLWSLRLIFGVSAFGVGVGVLGVSLFVAYDPAVDAEVIVRNDTPSTVVVRWDLNTPTAISAHDESAFEGSVFKHFARLSSVGEDGLTVTYSFDALDWGSSIHISVASPAVDPGE